MPITPRPDGRTERLREEGRTEAARKIVEWLTAWIGEQPGETETEKVMKQKLYEVAGRIGAKEWAA